MHWQPESLTFVTWARSGRGFGTDELLIDCQQSLIFFCKVTARETQARERRSSDKRGRKHEEKKQVLSGDNEAIKVI